MPARTLMFQGTGSDVGKSLLVAGLCRLFARQGLRVAPFKAQNMSNNAAVAADGGEIGRAQWLQAKAAGIEPSVHMNPVLLKPQSDRMSQVIVRGKAPQTMSAQAYHAMRGSLLPTVLGSYHTLAEQSDLVLIEGAGSAAEVNLREGDIANMGIARAVGCPVILIGDIDRGGVIASLVGTHAVLPPEDRACIQGFIVNKFRGDPRLFEAGMQTITHHTAWHGLGLVPFYPDLARLPQEDSLSLAIPQSSRTHEHGRVHVAVLALPHLANFDDLDPLYQEPGIRVSWCQAGHSIPHDAALVILPGTKSTIADLAFLRAQGWDEDLRTHHRRGGRILGICGGFQMLGDRLDDPDGIEGPAQSVTGLGFFNMHTRFYPDKRVTPWKGSWGAHPVTGYEIHCGRSEGAALAHPLLHGTEGPDGACSEDNRVWGTYVHGLFANDAARRAMLLTLGAVPDQEYSYAASLEKLLDGWADHLGAHLDITRLLA